MEFLKNNSTYNGDYSGQSSIIKQKNPPARIRVNGPHKVYKGRFVNCEGGCGQKLEEDADFYFINFVNEERSKRLCPDCVRKEII